MATGRLCATMDEPNSHSHNDVGLGFDNENENDGEAGRILLLKIYARMYSILKREMVRAGSEASGGDRSNGLRGDGGILILKTGGNDGF
jgi:hypothetical protein